MHLLDRPAAFNEGGGHPVEELGVARGFGHVAEVVRRGHDADAEVMHPEAIDQDAGRKRIGATGDGS